MPIVSCEPPAEAARAVYYGLVSRLTHAAFSPSKLQRANPHALSIAMPHRVAYLPADRIRPDSNIRSIVDIRSWRFLVHEKRKAAGGRADRQKVGVHVPIAAATAIITEGGNYELVDLNEGPLVIGTEKAVRRAEKLDEVQKRNFEAYLLVAPGIFIAALWLQDPDPEGDIFLEIPFPHPTFVDRGPMTPPEFLESVYDLAQRIYPV